MNRKKILIIVGGPKKKLEPFQEAAKKLSLNVAIASFSELEFFSKEGSSEFVLSIQGKDVASFDLIYIRIVGKRLEDASLLVNYARKHGIKIIDKLYEKSLLMPSSISKAIEMKNLIEKGIPIPKTVFGSLKFITEKAESFLGFPFVVKSTMGKKARDVWLPENKEELEKLIDTLREREKGGERFFAQKFIAASQRVRVLVIGNKAAGAITRPTKWRKRFLKKVNGEYPEGKKGAIMPVPVKYEKIAIHSSEAVSLDIAGVDILEEEATGAYYVIEVNAAPSWKAIAKDTGINVEEKILAYLSAI